MYLNAKNWMYNIIITAIGCPKVNKLNISHNNLLSLKHVKAKVCYAINNKLVNIICNNKFNYLYCSFNPITRLSFCKTRILIANNCKVTSLYGINKSIRVLNISNNMLNNGDYLPSNIQVLHISDNPFNNNNIEDTLCRLLKYFV